VLGVGQCPLQRASGFGHGLLGREVSNRYEHRGGAMEFMLRLHGGRRKFRDGSRVIRSA